VAEWFEEAFRADYLRVYPHRDDAEAAAEVADLAGRVPGLARGGRVLDLACGAGRHLRALRAAGVRAVGVDLSADLLAEARRLGATCIVRCDTRALPFRDGVFDAVACFFTSFGYFDSEAGDAATLREAARVLAGGGGLLLDLPDAAVLRRGLVPRSERTVGAAVVLEERRLVDGGRRVEKRVTVREGGGERGWTESVRLYEPAEVEAMAAGAGLAPRERLSTLAGAPRCVLVLRKGAA
jgi:SAM-dependent methyltransferase